MFLRDRLTDPLCPGVALRPQLSAAKDKLYTLLSNAIEKQGANSSYLLIGARGTGKTLVVGRTLQELLQKFNQNPASPTVGIVSLSGLLHSEEKTAFREIARQLCTTFQIPFIRGAAFADNLEFLREILKTLQKGHKTVVFILDEFDLFAKPFKQTVLYNLLDALQTSSVQAAVVAMSARFNVMDSMEKRVRSRFSHRRDIILELPAEDFDSPDSGPVALLQAFLSLPEGQCSEQRKAWNTAVKASLQDSGVWKALRLLLDKGLASPRDLLQIAQHAVIHLGPADATLQPKHLRKAIAAVDQSQNSMVDIIASQGILELFILVAALRLHRRGYQAVNFELLWAEYAKTRGMQHADIYSKHAAARAFQRLLDASLLAFSGPRTERTGLWEFAGVVAAVAEEEVTEGLQQHGMCPPLLKSWLAKDIVHVGSSAGEAA
ncbi:g73 [Coccomyxa viridis]|uniref:Origin recognition complex subunit 4 n=1 Tax=Coccomyxa viridis TaxID=1274662 RepID=A0ABP1FJZ4_9CHLO